MVEKYIDKSAILNQPYTFGDNIEIREFSLINATPMLFDKTTRTEAKKGCVVGNDVYIGPYALIMGGFENPTKIGNNVALGQYCNVGHDSIIGDRVKIIAYCMVSGYVEVGEGTIIHANTVIRNRIKIGKNCIIGQGSNVVEDIPDDTMAYGNPCKPQRALTDGKPDLLYRAKKKVQKILR